MLAIVPGHSAIVLDVFARTAGIPVAIIAGTDTNDPPPPASEFIAPEQKPAANRKARAGNITE
ncbi:MAG: hypothetical protein WDN29_09475 [Methylovirgula sp.]